MWTKSQKISAAVLGLAVTAFGVDRFVLDSGKAAGRTEDVIVARPSGAKTSSGSDKSAVKSVALVNSAGSAKSNGTTLASRLAALADTRKYDVEFAGDAFLPSDEWLAVYNAAKGPQTQAPTSQASVPAAGESEKTPRKIDYAGNFRSTHKLSAVMTRRGKALAIVDGRLYAAGQTLDGFTLTKVGLTDATFEGRGTSVTLMLPGQLTATSTGGH
jgi:hypothetical protein